MTVTHQYGKYKHVSTQVAVSYCFEGVSHQFTPCLGHPNTYKVDNLPDADIQGPEMNPTEQFESVQPVRDEVPRQTQKYFGNHPGSASPEQSSNLGIPGDQEPLRVVESVKVPVAYQVEQVEQVHQQTGQMVDI